MSFTYNPPGSLSGSQTGQNQVSLTWSKPTLINAPAILLHFDGTNGQTTTVDSSGNNYTVLMHDIALTTNDPKFGTASLATTSHSYAGTYALAVAYALGSPLDVFANPSWTIEGFVQMTDITGIPAFVAVFNTSITGGLGYTLQLFASLNGGGTQLTVTALNTGMYTGSLGQAISAQAASGLNVWHHFALVCDAGVTTIYLDGVAGSITESLWNPSTYAPDANPYMTIGSWINYSGGRDTSQIDEFAVWNYAKYTANFTPPTAPFAGNTTPPAGYDVYRNGASIATFVGTPGYVDYSAPSGPDTYSVAASDGSTDLSDLSSPFTITVAGLSPNGSFFFDGEAMYGAQVSGVLNLTKFTYMPHREPFIAGATNLIINRYKQEPTDSEQYGVDFSKFLVPGELLTSVVLSGITAQGVAQTATNPLVTPLVVSNIVIDPLGLKFAYTVSGGQNGIEYTIQFTSTTQLQTSNVQEIFSINVLIEDSFP